MRLAMAGNGCEMEGGYSENLLFLQTFLFHGKTDPIFPFFLLETYGPGNRFYHKLQFTRSGVLRIVTIII